MATSQQRNKPDLVTACPSLFKLIYMSGLLKTLDKLILQVDSKSFAELKGEGKKRNFKKKYKSKNFKKKQTRPKTNKK